LDVGCGTGNSSRELAKAFPKAQIHGVDCDKSSVKIAKERIKSCKLESQITMHTCFAHETPLKDKVDLITFFECLHDMHNPAEVLKSVKPLLKEGGVVFIADEKVEENLEEMTPKSKDLSVPSLSKNPTNWLGRLNYSFSWSHCLPQSMVFENSKGIGTCITAKMVKEIAKEAGYSQVDIIHENDFWRFYQVKP